MAEEKNSFRPPTSISKSSATASSSPCASVPRTGEPSHALVPVELLKNVYANIPTVLGMAKDAREKAGIADPTSNVAAPHLHNLTRVEFGLLENDADKVGLIFELNHALKLATQGNRVFLKNAVAFVQDKLAETEPKTA